jgi:GNAT superfamily N-acetyltransferase
MANARFRFEPLGKHHDRAAFSCGVEALDRYFHRQAGQDQDRKVAVVRVLYDAEAQLVAGYYTLSSASVVASGLPESVTKRLPRYPALPAVLIGRLATDRRYRGQGLGSLLLFDALRRTLALSEEVGITAVIVDAKDDAAQQFYERYGFQRLIDQERRLFLMVRTIRSVVEGQTI